MILVLLLGVGATLRAERLPIKAYSTADGLPHDEVDRIVADSRGFLWFCTKAGLARFDGYSFVNFGSAQGLPEGRVNDLLETRTHEYWLATDGGLVRFDPTGRPGWAASAGQGGQARSMFTLIPSTGDDQPSRTITVLREGRDGTLWAGTRNGLYRLDGPDDGRTLHVVDIGLLHTMREQSEVADILEDRFNTIWVTAPGALYRRWPDGSTARYTSQEGLPGIYLNGVTEDREGRFWVGSRDGGFFSFTADRTHARPTWGRTFSLGDGLPNVWVNQVFEASNGRFWVASALGLVEFFPNGDARGSHLHAYGQRNGLTESYIRSLTEDRAGNLWLASNAGAMKLVREGFTTYGRPDGISMVNAILEDRAGDLCLRGRVVEPSLSDRLGCFDGTAFHWFDPKGVTYFGWVLERTTLQARNGEIWLGTEEGVFRYSTSDHFVDVKTAWPRTLYTTPLGIFLHQLVLPQLEQRFEVRDDLAAHQVYRLFEDSHGDIWIATTSAPINGLAKWDATTDRIVDLGGVAGIPSLKDQVPRSFAEDSFGNIWIGFSTGVARYRHGAFTFFGTSEGLPPGAIMDIHQDRAGRCWLASDRAGLIRVDQSDSDRPTFVRYPAAPGLSSTDTEVITEDAGGFLYVGGGQGIDRVDPATGRVKHFTAADGLAPGQLHAGYQDRHGVLWFGTSSGLARLDPTPDPPATAPAPLISAVRVRGVAQIISALGEPSVALPDLTSDQNQLEIDFLALGFGAGEVLRYQYKLDGSREDWSAPTTLRTVNFGSLASGRYTFLVRAINSDGMVSDSPASVRFTILRPVWLRWWSLTLASVLIGAVVFSIYRYRLNRALELAEMRTRIATDLHDDIGANLTRIGLLSEVAKQAPDEGPLIAIGSIARESVGAMGDIVWAINPKRESLADLVRRMRQHGEEVFTLRSINLHFSAPDTQDTLRLPMDVRRDLLLIFKETVNNSARHSRCSSVSIDLRRNGSRLVLSVADNGVGFDTSLASTGQGLSSLRRRAERLNGTLDIHSAPMTGTTVTLNIPL